MPIPTHSIYRDAADFRITWQEALRWTLIIDEDDKIITPASATELEMFKSKVSELRSYSRTVSDNFLKEIVKKL
jgi:hypothetical protein